jgi:hypothetical protein
LALTQEDSPDLEFRFSFAPGLRSSVVSLSHALKITPYRENISKDHKHMHKQHFRHFISHTTKQHEQHRKRVCDEQEGETRVKTQQ